MQKNRMNLKFLFGLFVIALLVACAPEPSGDTAPESAPMPVPGEDVDEMVVEETPDPTPEETPEEIPEETPEETSGPDVVFQLQGRNFEFFNEEGVNPTLRVQEGQTVRIEFTSASGFHDWVLDEFGAATDRVRDGDGMTSVEFVADQAGTYEYYCSVGSHRAQGMFGTLIVE